MLVALLKLYHPDGTIPLERAKEICDLVPAHDLSNSDRTLNYPIARALCEAFPEHCWRVALNRRGEHTRAFLTVLDDDPREHYVDEDYCVHCGKNHQVAPNLLGDVG